MRVQVTISGLKAGDVIEQTTGRYDVVVGSYRRPGENPSVDVLRDTGEISTWSSQPGGDSGLVLRVGEGCEPTIEALKAFVQELD